jgi:L-arabinonolactonase
MQIVSSAERENALGEGPIWQSMEERLYWVDIDRGTLEWLDPRTGEAGQWRLNCRASAIALRAKGGLLLATDKGFAVFDTETARMQIVHHPEPDRTWNRSNDGHADAKGRFWLGTMDDRQRQRSGAVYRLEPDWSCTRVLDGLGIPNTLVCTEECDRLYIADSQDQIICSYDVEPESGELGARHLYAETRGAAVPDGSALDSDGFLWNAQWGGWRIVRYAADGTIDRVVSLPVERPTSCAFGGGDLSVLYVTTARKGLSAEALRDQPLAGSLLSFTPGVRGIPTPMFGG